MNNTYLNPHTFFMVPHSILKALWGEFEAQALIMYLRNTHEMLEASNKLEKDGYFFLTRDKILEKVGLSRRKFEKARNVLIETGLIEYTVKSTNNKPTGFFKFCVDKYNEIIINSEPKNIDDYYEEPIEDTQEDQDAPKTKENVPNLKENQTTRVNTKNEIKPLNDSYSDKIKNSWNAIAKNFGLAEVLTIKEDRIKKLKSILKLVEMNEKEFFQNIMTAVKESKFLRGSNGWKCNFDFFLQKSTVQKALEGAYKDNKDELINKLQNVETMTRFEASKIREDIKQQEERQKFISGEYVSIFDKYKNTN